MTRTPGFVLCGALLAGTLAGAQDAPRPARHALMPVPASLSFQPGRLAVTAGFTVSVAGHSDARLLAGLDLALRRLERRTGLEFPRGTTGDPAPAALVVSTLGPGNRIPELGEDESYTLDVSPSQALLKAPATVGALRGLETLLQLLQGDAAGYFFPAVAIRDAPRFPWRGLLIDVCRHFIPLDALKRNIDGMAAVKLNVLHLHLTEDQGFRIESRKYPRLHEMGSDGLYFTQDQVRDLVAYAAERGIRVVPEFDMPGHVSSWLVGHPELGSAPGPYAIARTWGVFDLALDPTRESTYKLLDGYLGEMAALFPDPYLHIGGDENNGKQWNANPAIQAFMAKHQLADAHALQAYFNQRLSKILKKHGKKMVGWDEILHPDLPTDIVVQSWRGPQYLADGARQGYQGILSSGYYVDLSYPTAQHYLVDPLPAGSGLSAAEAARVLGGEACMWAEWVTPETIDSRVWPRTAAIAERFWSPAEVRDVPDMYRRLAGVSRQLEDLGLSHEGRQAMMLRRLAGTSRVDSLLVLADAVEPVKGYRRGKERPATQQTPLTRLVDAARPESFAAVVFASAVDDMLADLPRFDARRDEVTARLTALRDIRPALDRVIDRAPVLQEVAPLGADLAEIGALGLEAVSYLDAGTSPPASWRDAGFVLLDRAATARADLQIAIVKPLRLLVAAASERAQADTLTPAAWTQRIQALAAPLPPRKQP